VLHLHGGWFNWGTDQAYRSLVGHIASSAGADAFVPDYRLAPENPFPSAVEAAGASYRGLLSSPFGSGTSVSAKPAACPRSLSPS
jgi:epsilon-lactone hydrolase